MSRLHKWGNIANESLNPLLSRQLITGEKIMLARIHLKKGGVVPPHAHVHEQMSCLIEGSLRFEMGGREYVLREGEVLHIPSKTEHSVFALEDSVALDIFSPIREDWLRGDDGYLRTVKTPGKRERKPGKRRGP